MIKPLFKNETIYTAEAYQKFLQFHEMKYGQKQRFKMLMMIILIVYLMLVNLRYENWALAILFVFIAIAYIFYKIKFQSREVEKEFKEFKIKKEEIFTFIFYKNYFKIKYDNKYDIRSYFKIYKINENEQYIYIYMDEMHSYLLDKQGFVQGDVDDFKKFLKKKCFYKF